MAIARQRVIKAHVQARLEARFSFEEEAALFAKFSVLFYAINCSLLCVDYVLQGKSRRFLSKLDICFGPQSFSI